MHTLKNNFIITSTAKDFESLLRDDTLFVSTNGSIGSKNHFTEGYGTYDYPVTLRNGFYNTYAFHYEENYKQFPQVGETIVNLPDATRIDITFNHEKVNRANMTLASVTRTLDMQTGVVKRTAVYQKESLEIMITEEKIVAHDADTIVQKISIEANQKGTLELVSKLRPPRLLENTPYDPRLAHAKKHLNILDVSCDTTHGAMTLETTNTNSRMEVTCLHDVAFTYALNQDTVEASLTVDYEEGIYSFEKATLYRDLSTLNPVEFEIDFDTLKEIQTARLSQFWKTSFIELSDAVLDPVLKYNVYSLYHHAPMDGLRSIAAKGISGEGYEGHYFWDTETYMLPYFILTHPSKAKQLLIYRYSLLPHARKEALNLGAKRGAKMPWRTISGKESSPYYPAGSAQIHINSDIALAYINYYYATLDDAFMHDYGVELLLETALFLLEYGHFVNDTFHIYGVTGPDEYTAIVNDNYYTNRLAKAHLSFVVDYVMQHYETLKGVLNRLGVTDTDLITLKKASESMALLVDTHLNVIKQDSSFLMKKEWDIDSIPKEHFPLLLHFHPLHIYKHQILKQADAVLAMVLTPHQVDSTYKSSVEYYAKRTTHDSSLSRCAYGIARYRLNEPTSGYADLLSVALLDFKDVKKHTKHGLHMANAGGSYLMIVFGLLGMTLGPTLSLFPAKQTDIKDYTLSFIYQGVFITAHYAHHQVTLSTSQSIDVLIYDQPVKVDHHHSFEVKEIDYIKNSKEDLR